MLIKKGEHLEISHTRKGEFNAVATEDFDTLDEWYPVATCQTVEGLNNIWEKGQPIPCKASLCTIKS